ncbi:MAG: SpoIIE family protein phosphatase [Flammeovirgaceae bacterium]
MLLIFFLCFQGLAQEETGKPYVTNYSYKTYHGHPQVFNIIQDERGLMYLANSRGVIIYDGTTWKKVELTNSAPAYTIGMDQQNRVFVGSYNEIGYLRIDQHGNQVYQSLLDEFRKVYEGDFEVVKIINTSERGMYFQVNNLQIKWDGEAFIENQELAGQQLFKSKDKIYAQGELGLSILVSDTLQPVLGGAAVDVSVEDITQLNDSLLLICTPRRLLQAQLFLLSDSIHYVTKVSPFESEVASDLKSYGIRSGLALENGLIALTTRGGGLYFISQEGKVIQRLSKENGLREDYAWNIMEDRQNQLWIALDNGIARVSTNPKFNYWDEGNGLTGYVVAVTRHQGKLYAATTTGLYYLENNEFKLVPATKGMEMSAIAEFKYPSNPNKTSLMISTLSGDHELVDGELIPMADHQPYGILQSKVIPSRVYFSSNGIYILEKVNGDWTEVGRIENIGQSLKSMQEDENGDLWCGGAPNHVIRINFKSPENWQDYTIEMHDSLVSPRSQDGIMIERYQGHLIFGTGAGFYAWNEEKQHFAPMAAFGKRYCDGRVGINKFNIDKLGNVWASISQDEDQWVEGILMNAIDPNSRYTFKSDSLSLRKLFNTYVECIYSEGDGVVWFGGPDGLIKYNSRILLSDQEVMPVQIRKVILNQDSVLFNGIYPSKTKYYSKIQPKEMTYSLPYQYNNITFHYSLPSFGNELSNQYRYYLEGYDEGWSEWSNETKKQYTNLHEGEYTFYVKARDTFGAEESNTSYQFTINAPWYRTVPAILFGILMSIVFFYSIFWLNTRRLQREKDKLEWLVSKRTNEIQQKNAELEQQKEEILLQTENLRTANDSILQKNIEIEKRNAEIAEQHDVLAEQNKEILIQRDRLQATFENMKVLSEVGQEITSHITIEEINNAVYQHVNALMDAAGFGIGIYNERMDRIEFPGYIEKGKKLPFHVNDMAEYKHLSAWCIKHKTEVFINDYEKESGNYVRKIEMLVGDVPKSLIYLPLTSSNKVIGVVTVQSFKKKAYSTYHLDLLRNIAIYASIALENASVYLEISKKNHKITDSINYARNIQHALLPRLDLIEEAFSDFFMIYRPKDIVSGDFYWFTRVGNKTVVAAVDCTGHGVPGAFMSLLGEVYISQIVKLQNILDPDLILFHLNEAIQESLNQTDKRNRDGMDAAICLIDRDEDTISYAGARRPLVYVTEGELKIIKGDRLSIGSRLNNEKMHFTKHVLPLKDDTTYYLYSDGYADQFGGENDTKLLEKNLHNILLSVNQLPLSSQKHTLEAFLDDWQGDRAQIDDILLMGFKI